MAPPPFLRPACRATAGRPQTRLISSTRTQACLYDMFMARPAAEIEPKVRIFSSNWILPGPMRRSTSRSIRTLRDGSETVEDFRMFGWLTFTDLAQLYLFRLNIHKKERGTTN